MCAIGYILPVKSGVLRILLSLREARLTADAFITLRRLSGGPHHKLRGESMAKTKNSGVGTNPNLVMTVQDADGNDIDLSKYPLQYGDADPKLKGAGRQAIEAFEAKRFKAKIEYNVLIDENGNEVESNRGGYHSCSSSEKAWSKASFMSHNHPRNSKKGDGGMLGGTFSDADIASFCDPGILYRTHVYVMRATASEGTYSISKVRGKFDGSGLKTYYRGERQKNFAVYRKIERQAAGEYYKGDITYKQYRHRVNDAFNEFLVAQHNALLAGQAKYGYNYTLEKRGG